MNEEITNRDKEFQLNEKIRSRRVGVFLILVGLVCMLKGLEYLNDTVAYLLVFALLLISIFVTQSEEDSRKQQLTSMTRGFFQFLVCLVRPLIVAFITALIVYWLKQIIGMPPYFLLGITITLIGFVKLGWSWRSKSRR